MPSAVLNISGARYGGWKKIRVARAMDRVSGSFELSVTERWPGQTTPRPIRPGQACTVALDGHTVITGYVDDVDVSYDQKEHTVTVKGRDKTGDLADCSAPAVQFSGRTLAQVARELCAPFGISVIDKAGAGEAFKALKGQEGDTVLELLESAARVRAVLLMADGSGNLVITRAGSSRAGRLRQGDNVETCRGSFSMRDRFQEYTVKGQGQGSDEWSGSAAAHPKAMTKDSGVGRHRPKTVVAEETIDQAAAAKRAAWERNVRFGRSRSVTYTVPGWTHSGGLWVPNTVATVHDAFLGYDGAQLLVSSVAWIMDDNGSSTELELCPREAFERVELPEPDDSQGGW